MDIEPESVSKVHTKKSPVKQESSKNKTPVKKTVGQDDKHSSRKRSIADALGKSICFACRVYAVTYNFFTTLADSDENKSDNDEDTIPATPQNQPTTKRVRKDTSAKEKAVAKKVKLTKKIESSDEDDIPPSPQEAPKRANKTALSKTATRLRRIVDSDSEDGNYNFWT